MGVARGLACGSPVTLTWAGGPPALRPVRNLQQAQHSGPLASGTLEQTRQHEFAGPEGERGPAPRECPAGEKVHRQRRKEVAPGHQVGAVCAGGGHSRWPSSSPHCPSSWWAQRTGALHPFMLSRPRETRDPPKKQNRVLSPLLWSSRLGLGQGSSFHGCAADAGGGGSPLGMTGEYPPGLLQKTVLTQTPHRYSCWSPYTSVWRPRGASGPRWPCLRAVWSRKTTAGHPGRCQSPSSQTQDTQGAHFQRNIDSN